MGTRSASRTALQILAAFLENRTWRQRELADRVGVSSETIRGNLLLLRQEGVPFERQEESSQVFWSVPATWAPDGIVIKNAILDALLRVVARAPATPARAELVRRLTSLLPNPDVWKRRLEVVAGRHHGDRRCLDALEDAATRRTSLTVRYHSVSRGVLTWRVLSVQRVIEGERFVAYCHRNKEMRWFRVDCVVETRSDDSPESYRELPFTDVEAFVRASVSGFAGTEAVQALSFRVRHPEARWVERNLPFGDREVEPLGNGMRVIVRTNAVLAVARYVAGLGGAAFAESKALRDEVHTLAREALAACTAGEPLSTRTEDQSRPIAARLGQDTHSAVVSDGATVATSALPKEGSE